MSTNIFVGQTIDFDEEDGSPSGQMQGGQYVITIQGFTSWSVRDAFAYALIPVGTTLGGANGVGLVANPKFRVATFKWDGFGGLQAADSQGLNTYRLAKWTITCHVPQGQNLELTQPYTPPDPVPWLVHRWSIGGQYLTLPQRLLRWVSDNKVPSKSARGATFVPSIEHSISWPRLLVPNYPAIRNCMGTVNSVAMQFATGLIAVEQLLFLGAESERQNLSDGTLGTNLVLKFSERPLKVGSTPITWNHLYRDDAKSGLATAPWDRIKVSATGLPAIPLTDHRTIFTF